MLLKCFFFAFRMTATEVLDMLAEEADFQHATVFLQPPAYGQESDEDSGNGDNVDYYDISRAQLLSEAEYVIDYGSHIVSSVDDYRALEEVDGEPDSSSVKREGTSAKDETSTEQIKQLPLNQMEQPSSSSNNVTLQQWFATGQLRPRIRQSGAQ